MIEIQPAALGMSSAVEPILRALPDWFGIEHATRQYIHDAGELPTFLAVDTERENTPVGFLTLKQHSEASAEIHVMGVLPDYHRRGAGRALVAAAEDYLRDKGVLFLQVKTLSASHPDEGYGKTRAFYLAMGFRLLEEFPELWGPGNPCWQLVKAV
ncbi:MAG: GNAT family N-acetyltransferase [Chloroflexi bacterium]|nr:GNAT family N-acetyltransferase [Chloroflexota bacterium]